MNENEKKVLTAIKEFELYEKSGFAKYEVPSSQTLLIAIKALRFYAFYTKFRGKLDEYQSTKKENL